MDENRVATAYASEWLSPQEAQPPRGLKLLLRTEGGVAVIGLWNENGGFTHWAHLPKLRREKSLS